MTPGRPWGRGSERFSSIVGDAIDALRDDNVPNSRTLPDPFA